MKVGQSPVSGVRGPALENLEQLGHLGHFDFLSTRTQPFPFLM